MVIRFITSLNWFCKIIPLLWNLRHNFRYLPTLHSNGPSDANGRSDPYLRSDSVQEMQFLYHYDFTPDPTNLKYQFPSPLLTKSSGRQIWEIPPVSSFSGPTNIKICPCYNTCYFSVLALFCRAGKTNWLIGNRMGEERREKLTSHKNCDSFNEFYWSDQQFKVSMKLLKRGFLAGGGGSHL